MKNFKGSIVLCLILVASIWWFKGLGTIVPQEMPTPFSEFPKVIGNFTFAGSQQFSEAVVESAGMDEYIMWSYKDPDGYVLGLYVGFYRDQTEGSIIHSPKHCMPGSGWEPSEVGTVEFQDPQGHRFKVNRMVLQKGVDKQLAYYWYQGRGRVLASEYADRAYMVLDSIALKRSDGALVRITGPGNNVDEYSKKQQQFMGSLMPVLEKFLPQ
nr:EpsI family protein [Desulfobulbaceae bacterium]